jgi:hypothetical protein
MHSTRRDFLIAALISAGYLASPPAAWCMSAREIIDQMIKRNIGDTARIAVQITTLKGGAKSSSHSLWFVQRTEGQTTTILLDFEEPAESRGLRFLFKLGQGSENEAYMYLPTTKKTLPLALEDESTDIGGTGLTMEDFLAVAAKPGQVERIVKEEDFDGRKCWVIEVTSPGSPGSRLIWVAQDQLITLKSEQIGPDGKTKRTLKVTEFFKTEKGMEFPREEEVTIHGRNIRIRVRQEHAVFGVQIAPESLDPMTFGGYQRAN